MVIHIPFDYDIRPTLDRSSLDRVTNTLAMWLPSDEDDAPVASWSEPEWAAAEWVAYWQNAIPWLVDRLHATAAPVTPLVLLRLEALATACRERTRRMLDATVELLCAFDQREIEAIPLKGAALAPLYYPDPLVRPLGDIDLLLKPERLTEATQVVRNLGYRFYSNSDEDEVYLRGEYKTNMWAPDNVHPLELHFSLREEYAGLVYDLTEMMWQTSNRQAYWQGSQALVPAPSMLLHHVCAHATSDWITQRGRLMHLDDVRRLAVEFTEDDWQAFSLGVPPEGARFTWPMLAWAQRYAGIISPGYVLADLEAACPAALCDWVKQTELASTSLTNPTMRSGIGFNIIGMLSRSRAERTRMWLRSVFPRRWNLTKRYPRLVKTPFWPLAYVLINMDRFGHVVYKKLWHR